MWYVKEVSNHYQTLTINSGMIFDTFKNFYNTLQLKLAKLNNMQKIIGAPQ